MPVGANRPWNTRRGSAAAQAEGSQSPDAPRQASRAMASGRNRGRTVRAGRIGVEHGDARPGPVAPPGEGAESPPDRATTHRPCRRSVADVDSPGLTRSWNKKKNAVYRAPVDPRQDPVVATASGLARSRPAAASTASPQTALRPRRLRAAIAAAGQQANGPPACPHPPFPLDA